MNTFKKIFLSSTSLFCLLFISCEIIQKDTVKKTINTKAGTATQMHERNEKVDDSVLIQLPKNANYYMQKNMVTENQYLSFYNSKLYFIGTTDDFDEAREGYLPGYFHSIVEDLKIDSKGFTFMLDASKLEFYTVQDAPGISPQENEIWDIVPLKGKRTYRATIIADTIYIETKDFDTRKFIKTNAG
ncbi:Hypothetical protein I595_686 [Croceitalea dokdonensis DOKDO 023]|uniref:Lipoprotein n=1 Tax=Croceitalea dokdonensis DOKDO 023 TaxID=1300341 RepID=A0A0N8H4M4_9FLAO|nr:hypothetical protein [Croceitalea dokdonensis]KPM33780.1 Hypothetical protein I595_686 [Croceitalea dokdonensis DOKDO 023]